MGYETRFTGTVHGPKPVYDKFRRDALADTKRFGEYSLPLDFWFYSDNFDQMKWYGYNKDCIELSLEYPNLLFTLEGEGEESGDIWKAWYRNGKFVEAKAKIVFDEPDLDSLLPLDHEAAQKMAETEARELAEKAEKAKAEALEAAKRAHLAALRAGADLEASKAQIAEYNITDEEYEEIFGEPPIKV